MYLVLSFLIFCCVYTILYVEKCISYYEKQVKLAFLKFFSANTPNVPPKPVCRIIPNQLYDGICYTYIFWADLNMFLVSNVDKEPLKQLNITFDKTLWKMSF